MDGHKNGGDDAERRHRISDTARKRGARKWLNYGSRLPPAFKRHELDEYKRELAVRRHASSSSSAAGSSSAGASSSQIIAPVKREPEELGLLAVKLKADAGPPRRGVIGPEDYLPPGQEDHLVRAIMERSVREAEEVTVRTRHELEIEEIFLEQGIAASQENASKEADLRIMKAEQAKVWIDLDSDSDKD